MLDLTAFQSLARLARSESKATAASARIASIHYEDLATRTLVLAPGPFQRLPRASYLWIAVRDDAGRTHQRRLPVVGAGPNVRITLAVERGDTFADTLAFRTRVGDRVQLSLAPQ